MTARQVVLDGGSPWGFRIHGGCDVGQPLKISRVNPGSKAAQRGIREGDIISSINGTSTRNLDNSTAHSLLKNAGPSLRLSLNEDGLSSPRRRVKQVVTTSIFSEKKTPSGEIVSKTIEVKKFENGDAKVTTERVKAQVHAEQAKGSTKENDPLIRQGRGVREGPPTGAILRYRSPTARGYQAGFGQSLHLPAADGPGYSDQPYPHCRVKELSIKMPRKNKKPKAPSEKKSNDENDKSIDGPEASTTEDDKKVSLVVTGEKSEKKGLFLSLDKKLKFQMKKQKKKEKHLEFSGRNKKSSEEVSLVPEVEWVSAEELKVPEEECNVEVVEDTVQVSQVEVIDDSANPSEMSEEEERTLREFLKTLDIIDSQSVGSVDNSKNEEGEIVVRNKQVIETIPEDLFEEFIENEEIKQTREAIRTFPRTSPKHSPKSRRKDPVQVETPTVIVNAPPKVLYNYYGASYTEPNSGNSVAIQDVENGIVVIKTYRFDDEDRFFNRRLDVILEESSDFSDGSSQSDKKRTILDDVVIQTRPVHRETVKIYNLGKQDGVIDSVTGKDDSRCVRPVMVETLKMSEDVVKIELAGSESEGDFEINQSEALVGIGGVEIVNIDSDNSGECAKSGAKNTKSVVDMADGSDKCDWSVKSVSSNSTKVNEGEEDEEESESRRSSSFNQEFGDGAEADVESELDSSRAFFFNDAEDSLSIKMSDILDDSEEIEIFITDFKNVESSQPVKERVEEEDVVDAWRHSWKSLNSLPVYEVDAKGLFHKNFLSSAHKNKQTQDGVTTATTTEKDEEAQTSSEPSVDYADDRDRGRKNGELPHTRVNVKDLANTMKDSMDKILMSKIKVIKHYNEPRLSETSWVNILDETGRQMERKDTKSSSGSESSIKQNRVSDSSSYENVPKREKSVPAVEEERLIAESAQNPEALCNLAEKKVLTLPYGRLVLKKIGLGSCCSKDSDNKDLEEEMYVKSNIGQTKTVNPRSSEVSTVKDSNQRDEYSYIEFDYSNPNVGEKERWYGRRTVVPAVLLGLSPSQRRVYEEKYKKSAPDETEAASLLDLHRKFIERRSYNESSPWTRDRFLVFDSKTKPSSVSVTGISPVGKFFGTKSKKSEIENKKGNDADKMKGMKFAMETVKSDDKVGRKPGSWMTRLVGNEKSENECSLLNSKCFSEEEKEEDCKTEEKKEKKKKKDEEEEKKKKKEGERERNQGQTNEELEAVGNSCLLAILQNAISDEFVPELNTESSIESSCESHEVSLVHNQETMMDLWQKGNKLGSTSKKDEETWNADLYDESTRNFQRFWNKEINLTNNKRKGNLDDGRSKTRPRTICYEGETELYIDEPKYVKTIRSPRSAVLDKVKTDEKEELVITENLPAVSDVIKSFEKPILRKPLTENNNNTGKKTQIQIESEKYQISKKGDIALIQNGESRRKAQKEKRKSMPASILSEREIFKQKMYDEYMSKLAERIERRQQKVIKVSQSNEIECPEETKWFDLENEFINKVKERREKMGAVDEGNEQKDLYECIERKCQEFRNYWEGEISNLEDDKYLSVDGGSGGTETTNSKRSSVHLTLDATSDVDSLPKHLKELLQVDGEDFPEFLDGKFFEKMPSTVTFSPTFKATAPRPGVWSPAHSVTDEKTEVREESEERKKLENEPIPPVWTPRSAQASPVLERKEFRPVNFESPTLPRKKYIQDDKRESSVPPPWQQPGGDKLPELAKSPSSPVLSLPKAPNPTVTLLQKAREGHLPRGAHYLNSEMNESPASDGTTIERLEIVSSTRSESDRPRKIETGPKKIVGIGPITKEGIPLVLRSEVTAENKEKWYKRMYDSLHKAGKDDDYVTVKYRTSPSRKGVYGYQHGSSSGYQSEPESLSYDRSANNYVTLDRRRSEKSKENECISVTLPRSRSSPPRRDFGGYKNQPGRIEDYEPGHSSISELETNKWWDEVLEIFDRWLERNPEARHPACNKLLIDAIQSRREEEKARPSLRKSQSPRSFTNYASGYISDPQYVYKRSEDELQSPPSCEEQKEAYKIIQKGGEIPLRGLRKPAPERPKDRLETEIEYFPLSPTLTRIRVHKQNITPLSELPFCLYPLAYPNATLNFASLPFGVCSSFSQVQIFPPPPPLPLTTQETGQESHLKQHPQGSDPSGKDQKFSVQLQNISGPEDYVQIVPKPRQVTKKPAPIYANIPIRKSPPLTASVCQAERKVLSERVSRVPIVSSERNPRELVAKKVGPATTFSDLKRVAPSINSLKKLSTSKIPTKVQDKKPKEVVKKKEVIASETTTTTTTKASAKSKKTKSNEEDKENSNKKKSIPEKGSLEKVKKDKKKIVSGKSQGDTDKKSKDAGKGIKGRVPLSESVQREKPLSKTNKRFKTISENLKKKKPETKKESGSDDLQGDIIEYLSRFVDSDLETSYLDLKTPEEDKPQTSLFEDTEEEDTMSPIYESIGSESAAKAKVEPDITGVFRSRSFSPEVRRKIFKLPDMNKPVPPKRKESRNSPTLKMWSKMMVSYPNHRSRLEAFDSNVKFLRDRLKRKLAQEKEVKSEFGDDVETVRTVKKDKNGAMSIKTNRYVRLTRPTSGSVSTRATYPDIERRRLLSEPRTRFGLTDTSRYRKYSDASTITKSAESDSAKKSGSKPKGVDTVVRSSTTYSVRNPASQEEDKRKSVKVTVAISSKGKELLRKTAGLTAPPKKGAVSVKSSSSPCPSVSSYRSGMSGKSPLSDKGSTSSRDRIQSPPTRFFSPNSSIYSRSTSPCSVTAKQKTQKTTSDSAKKPTTSVSTGSRISPSKPEVKKVIPKPREMSKTSTVTKSPGKRLLTQVSNLGKSITSKEDLKKKIKRNGKSEPVLTGTRYKKNEIGKPKTIVAKKIADNVEEEKNEVVEGRDLVRTDSFFQNLFLRGPYERRSTIERVPSVLERARRYQRRINWPETYKSEPSLSLVTFYLNQKRPVSFSRFRNLDRSLSSSRSHSPLGSLHSETFQMKLRRFDSMSQFGDAPSRDFSPEAKERSSSEPPLHRSQTNSPEISSMRSSPNSSRSPSCRRIQSYRSSARALDGVRDLKKTAPRARSAGEIEEVKSKSGLEYGDLGKSTSSLNLSNLSDYTEYQAYVLELMHSTRKCERFRELHKFYSNLEKMGKLEKTASTGDLRPRLKNEEIIDFDRWKKIRTKERAEAELKKLVDNLVQVQKEKDLLFRAADVEAVRWKGDSGLRIKERSVEDLKEQFNKTSHDDAALDISWRRDLDARKDHYKPLWRGSSIVDVANNLNNTLTSYRGRPITLEELEKIEKANARIGKEYGYSLKAWSSLSNEQVNALKDQLSEIYAQDFRRRGHDGSVEEIPERYEVLVPKDSEIKSPGESSLHVRCSSALSKSQTYTPVVKRKEEFRKEWKKAESISSLPSWKSDSGKKPNLPPLPWKDEEPKFVRSHSEGRSPKSDRHPIMRSKSASSKPLSENEKKRLSLTLSREVIEKMTKASGKGPLFPRETLGALAVAGSKLRDKTDDRSDFLLSMTPSERKLLEEWEAKSEPNEPSKVTRSTSTNEPESGSGSSETSIKTVIRKNSMDVLKKVQYFEDLQQSTDGLLESEVKDDVEGLEESDTAGARIESLKSEAKSKKEKNGRSSTRTKKEKKKTVWIPSSSLENINEYFGQQRQYATTPVHSKPPISGDSSKSVVQAPARSEDFHDLRNYFEDKKWPAVRYHSASPVGLRSMPSGSSNESLFSYRSRSVSPDPTKYYRAYLKMVKCGAVRKLCNRFESWEDLLSLSSDKDFWLPPAPRKFASDPELTRDLLKRFGTDPTKVTIRGQEVGDVRWLRTKFERDLYPARGRSRFRRVRSPLVRSPLAVSDRLMPRINVISKTAELQLQGLGPDRNKHHASQKDVVLPSKIHELAASPEGYRSLIDYTKDHGGYYYTGEVEKLRRKFERLQKAERLSILGQMYTSTPDVNELRDIAPYLECSWVAHRYPRVTKTVSSPDLQTKKQEPVKKAQTKPRPHSSSPIRPKQPSSILKPSYSYPDRSIFADQKFDPSIHRPKYRYQPEREVDRRYKRGDPDWWRPWNRPTVTFKESVSFKTEPQIRDLSPDSPRKYVESEVTIHYKSPVRSEAKEMLSEDELARRQAESMKRIYKEERRRKYLQELQDMNSRRHTDNFTPSQKSPIPLNRYDDFPFDSSMYSAVKGRDFYSTDPVMVARGLYDFVGRRPRELAFRRGDIIFIIRRLDKNWCEGELNGAVGLFPLSYVEVIPYNEINLKYGRARAKYDFVPQTSLELSAHKGDMITLIRKIDENWFEGRIGERTGIIPASYCHVMAMPQPSRVPSMRVDKVNKPVAAPAAHSLIHNGSGLSSKHYYTPYLSGPNSPGRSTVSSTSANLHDGHTSADMLIDEALMQLDEEFDLKRSASKSTSQPLNVRINPRPEPALYEVLFNHVPNNDDELELIQGETVTVVEKCGDGWYIGSKTSDGKLGIFPGTHVRRIAPEFV